ncbi:hypothetical protein E2C01_051934 [Portunus trituberculatus]|uniref:Uncharacterized protein n=1 Tax=Portunus trituberculatus TaxID=210409 RepID=A0A5B7GG77_PORTR|nr:hypothetical protein [Portunus trituberculatus]
MVKHKNLSGSREVADLVRKTSSSGLSREGESPPEQCPVLEVLLRDEYVASLPLTGSGFKTELLHSRNIADSDTDYIPNLFGNHLEFSVPEVRQIPPPRSFVRKFIHASRYLTKENGTVPEGNLKKYGKGVLVLAKDIMQARMLQHLPNPTDSMFDTVKAHPTFNYSKGVYSQDLYEFSEEEILAMCPSSVHKVTKMRNSSNIVLLTFESTLPDRVHIGPTNLMPLKGVTKRHSGSAESIDLAQAKQSKISHGAHDRESFRDHSAMATPMVSVEPAVTPSVSDLASCNEGALKMESSGDAGVTAVPQGPTVVKNAVRPEPCPPVPSRNSGNSHHSPVGRKAAVHQPKTSQLPVSSRRLIILSQVSHGQTLQKACPSAARK